MSAFTTYTTLLRPVFLSHVREIPAGTLVESRLASRFHDQIYLDLDATEKEVRQLENKYDLGTRYAASLGLIGNKILPVMLNSGYSVLTSELWLEAKGLLHEKPLGLPKDLKISHIHQENYPQFAGAVRKFFANSPVANDFTKLCEAALLSRVDGKFFSIYCLLAGNEIIAAAGVNYSHKLAAGYLNFAVQLSGNLELAKHLALVSAILADSHKLKIDRLVCVANPQEGIWHDLTRLGFMAVDERVILGR